MARILVAEDSPTQAERLAAALEARGFEVTRAPDGEQALKRFDEGFFDVVISDVVMPGMSGYDLCRAIKMDRNKRNLPVILLTSLSEPMDVIHGLECGADNFLTKPYQMDELIRRIDGMLANVRLREAGRVSLGIDIMFLGNKFTITSEKEQILDLLISTFEATVRANRELQKSKSEIAAANTKMRLYASQLESRVRERTATLASTNEALQAEIAVREQTHMQLVHAQRMEAIGNLTGGMAHDFNNLLGVIIGNLDLLRPVVASLEQADELVAEALDAALRGADLTQRLLAFARRQPLKPECVSVNELVIGITKLLGRVLGEQTQVSLDLGTNVWPIMVDPAQLEASLTNLATNARDAMPTGGKLRFSTRNQHLDADYAAHHLEVTAGDYAVIEVSDTGTGMAPEILSRIFEPFYTTKEKAKGTGLGLAMVFGFMKQSRGHISVYSEQGIGTVFRLYLPRGELAIEAKPQSVSEAVALGKGETVLAVEDNSAMQRVVAMQLGALNYRVLEAGTAGNALAILEREKVDLLFSDVVMPGGMNGVELARKTLAQWPEIRVVLTSGFSEPILLEELGSLRNVRLLRKPYRRADLALALRDALDA